MDTDLEKHEEALKEAKKCEVPGVSEEYFVDSAVHAVFFFVDSAVHAGFFCFGLCGCGCLVINPPTFRRRPRGKLLNEPKVYIILERYVG